MVRIYLPYVSNVIESLGKLSNVRADEPRKEHLQTLYSAYNSLNEFLYRSLWAENLKVCKGPGKNLLDLMETLYGDGSGDGVLDYLSVALLQQSASAFRLVLDSEFQTSGVYLVTAKRGYDLPTLLESAETIFPPEVNDKLPQIREDLREAGRCLAFDLGTAAGFHLLRALETAVCSYWYVVMNKSPLPKNRNLGQYIMEMSKGDHAERKKVLFALRQVKDLHRNSIMHPEESLTLDEAIALLNTVQSAITLMLPVVDGEHGRMLMEQSAALKLREYEAAEAKETKEALSRRQTQSEAKAKR